MDDIPSNIWGALSVQEDEQAPTEIVADVDEGTYRDPLRWVRYTRNSDIPHVDEMVRVIQEVEKK